jgi:hypothetical protein
MHIQAALAEELQRPISQFRDAGHRSQLFMQQKEMQHQGPLFHLGAGGGL